MKKTLAAVSIGAALAAGSLGLAGPASATNQQDVQFIQLLDDHDINANGLGTQWGQGVCIDLTNHFSWGWTTAHAYQYAVDSVYYNTGAGFDRDHAQWFVAASVAVYCPWNAPASHGGTTV